MLSLKIIQKVIWIIVRALLNTVIVIGIIFIYAFKIEPNWIQVKEQPINIIGLPQEFEGLRIIQLSDLHGHLFSNKELVKKVNNLKPDLVAITGDVFDDENRTSLEYPNKVINGINARYGSYFVFGNNDFYLGKDKVVRVLTSSSIKTLVNQNDKISFKGKTLWIIGVNDPHEGKANISLALKKTDESPKILLAHSPEIINDASKAGIDLVLAGHTHGGQIKIPYVPRIITFVKKGYEQYISGLYKVGKTQLYVNRGLGLTKIPLRFLVRPEITVITLHRN